MNEGRKFRIEIAHRTVHFGAFPLLSLPWKRNNMIPFNVIGVYVAVSNIRMFIFAIEMQQCVPFALLSSYNIFGAAVNNNQHQTL
jgi:hypothetical protein